MSEHESELSVYDKVNVDISDILKISYECPETALKGINKRFCQLQALHYQYECLMQQGADLVAKTKSIRYDYYTGRITPKNLKGEAPYQIKLTKAEADVKVLADSKYLKALNLLREYERCVKSIENAMQRLKSVPYEIKTVVEHRRLVEGY